MILRCLVLASLCGCTASRWQQDPPDAFYQREAIGDVPHPPNERPVYGWWEQVWESTLGPIGGLVSPARWAQRVGIPRPAADTNAFGQVADSGWFQNRITRLQPDDWSNPIMPTRYPEAGPLQVLRARSEDLVPRFLVRDRDNVQWVLVFDPPAFPELVTGSAMISTHVLYAAGYQVPETSLFWLDVSRLEVGAAALERGHYNELQPMKIETLQTLVGLLNPDADGRVRALCVRWPDGVPVGPWRYDGMRTDIPSDRVYHEDRRSLRGLRVFASWLNQVRAVSERTMSFWQRNEKGRGQLTHYIIGVDDGLGALEGGAKPIPSGYQYDVDWPLAFWRLAGLGWVYPQWLDVRANPYPALGVFESEVFDPRTWEPAYHNTAFAHADRDDIFWAASILAHFTPQRLSQINRSASWSEQGAEVWLYDVLLHRREKILRYAFTDRVAIGFPTIEEDTLRWRDLEHVGGLRARPRSLTYVWTRLDDDTVIKRATTAKTSISIPASVLERTRAATQYKVTLQPGDGSSERADIFLRVRQGSVQLSGMEYR